MESAMNAMEKEFSSVDENDPKAMARMMRRMSELTGEKIDGLEDFHPERIAGRILGMGPEDGLQVISADVPQAEMFKFCSELRSITSGQGSFEMDFSRYEQVPAHMTSKVIETAKAEKEG